MPIQGADDADSVLSYIEEHQPRIEAALKEALVEVALEKAEHPVRAIAHKLMSHEEDCSTCVEPLVRSMTLGTADEVFYAADKNGDGVLTQPELCRMLSSRGHRSKTLIGEVMSSLDEDGDGKISIEEWRKGHYKAHIPEILEMVRAPRGETFADLRPNGCTIAKTELRAITLMQLHDVYAHIERRCEAEGWCNHKGKLLRPEEVTLYDATRYVIKPATAHRRCSYVELVASGPQRPAWFVSHWWGEPVARFLRCIEQHAVDHGLKGADAAYWVCAYANNQHDVQCDIGGDPAATSFMRAIKLAEGRVLTVLDENGVTYERVWCCLEISAGLDGTYEVYTAHEGCEAYDGSQWQSVAAAAAQEMGIELTELTRGEVLRRLPLLKDRRAVGLTSTMCAADVGRPALQTYRQQFFPIELVLRAFGIRIEAAKATVPHDKRTILNHIAQRPLHEPMRIGCLAYDELNLRLHGAFAAAAFRLLLETDEDMEWIGAKLRHSGLRALSLSLRDCKKCTDDTCALLAAALPPTTAAVAFELAGSSASAAGAVPLLHASIRLGTQLEVLDMSECGLTGAIPDALGQCTVLRTLRLRVNRLTGAIPDAIGECAQLQQLWLDRNLLSGGIPSALGKCAHLRVLALDDNELTGQIPPELGRLNALQELWLSGNQLAGGIPDTLGKCTALEKLILNRNQLVGCVPRELAECKELRELRVEDNLLLDDGPEEVRKSSAASRQIR